MNFRQLQIFKAVADTQSFANAAKSLFIVQSAVSTAVKKLEEELGLILLSRSKKAVELTDEGRVLLKHANKILTQASEARLELAEMNTLNRGQVVLGAPAMLAAYYLPDVLVQFHKRYPFLRVSIIDVGTKHIQSKIEQGEIDMGIVNIDEIPSNLEARLVLSEEILVCLPKSHALANKKSIKFREFAQHPLILYREGYFLREAFDVMCETHKIEPKIHIETNLVQLMKSLVESGAGIGVCLKSAISYDEELIGISFNPKIKMNFGIAWKEESYLSKANQAFIKFLISTSNAKKRKSKRFN